MTNTRILHVDDEPQFGELVSTFLERENDSFTVISEQTARSGLERLDRSDVDCVISDFDMPRTDGLEFLEAVRNTGFDLPFILFTGKGSEEIASRAILAGATDYLQKRSGTDQYTLLANRVENAVEQYRSRQALETNEKRLSLFIEQSPLGVIEWDDRFNFVRLNDRAEEILGYAEAELRGRPWDVVVPETDHDVVESVVRRTLEADSQGKQINQNVTADGELITCEWHNHEVTNDDGDVVAVFSQFQDISARVKREKQLRWTTARLEGLLDHSPDLICLFDDHGTLLDVNSHLCERLGYAASELIGSKIWDLDRTVEATEARASWRQLATGETRTFEGRYVRGDGSTVPVQVHLGHLEVEGKDQFLAIGRDSCCQGS